jgi:hypothetical protein
MVVEANTQTGTWGISARVRRLLAKAVLDLRSALEDDFRKQLIAVGVRETGIQPVPAGRLLTAAEQRARDVASAMTKRDMQGGSTAGEAFETFVRESAFTFLNRAVGLRCLDERGLLLVAGQYETAIKLDRSRNASSLYWRVRNEMPSATPPREVWRETLRRAGAAISERIGVLFDPESEHALLLPLQPTLQRVMNALNASDIPADVYAQDELLGWVYQYYNAREKDEVYARLGKGKKLERPEELVAATCLYTERYMVDYLIQNTLGALWVEMHPESRLPERWPYYVRPPEGDPIQRREPRPLRDITLLDPACGSGHFLVRAFDQLVEMYREEGRECDSEIPHLIIERNLHGIDIDLRAIQIAVLALYLKACALGGPEFKPRQLNLVSADAILPGEEPTAEYVARLRDDPELQALVKGVWRGLANVREFGSLLHPERAVDEVVHRRREQDRRRYPMLQRDDADWALWKRDLLRGLREEFDRQAQSQDLGQRLFGEDAAKGVSLVEALERKYDVVVMNPPYAGSKNMSDQLKKFVEREYREGKQNLYTAFICRSAALTHHGGHVGMVTPHSAFFITSANELRQLLLTTNTFTTLVQLGRHAFSEGDPPGEPFLFTFRRGRNGSKSRLTAIRIGRPMPAQEQADWLLSAVAGKRDQLCYRADQDAFLKVPGSPFIYWLRSRFFEVLGSYSLVQDLGTPVEPSTTGDNPRFVRFFWECINRKTWLPLSKGGGYAKWYGLRRWSINWRNHGTEVKSHPGAYIRNESLMFQPGLTYTESARGKIGARVLEEGETFGKSGPGIIAPETESRLLQVTLNSRLSSFLGRIVARSFLISLGAVSRLPVLSASGSASETGILCAAVCCELKKRLVDRQMTERTFTNTLLEPANENCSSLLARYLKATTLLEAETSALHAVEGFGERLVFDGFGFDEDDVASVLNETGTPAGWLPLVSGYADAPTIIDQTGHYEEIAATPHFNRAEVRSDRVPALRKLLRDLYEQGPGAGAIDDGEGESADREREEMSLGARIPMPAETFLEELSQRLELNPVSTYWLLKEMREDDGLVSPPELKRHLEDYISVTLLRVLGFRWPEQDALERNHGPMLEPSLVDEDGIIPLVKCGDQPTADELCRRRLESDLGEEGAVGSQQEFRRWVGRDVEEWLRRDFFRRHVQQFKMRPIAWHIISPERTFEAFVLYHKLGRATLQKLRVEYAGALIDRRLRREQERARQQVLLVRLAAFSSRSRTWRSSVIGWRGLSAATS